jgi:transposase
MIVPMTPLYQPATLFPFEPSFIFSAQNYSFIGPTPARLTEIKSERVDRLPVVFAILVQMELPDLIDASYVPHGNHQGLSVGWLVLIFLVYILTEANHKLVSVQQWVAEHQHTLERLTGQTIRPTDCTDDRLADVLRYLSQDEVWWQVEQKLSQRLIRVYDLDARGPVRLDATVAGVNHNPKQHALFKLGRNKAGGFEVQFKLMLGVLDPLGLAVAVDVVSGETADDPLYVPLYRRIRQTLGQVGRLYVGDSKMAALDNRAAFVAGGDYYLTPLPLTGQTPLLLAELLLLVEAGQVELIPIYHPELLMTEPDPVEAIAAGFEVLREQSTRLEDGTRITWLERLLVIRSHAFAEAQSQALEQRLTQAQADLLALTPPPDRGKRQVEDPAALQQAIDLILTRQRVADYFDIQVQRQVTCRHVRPYRGRPARTEQKVRYQLSLTRRQADIDRAKQHLGWRLYATNAPGQKLNLAEAVAVYRDQYLAERNFARLKGPLLTLLPLYVQRDDHALGLIRLLTLALRALTLIEFVARRALVATGQSLAGLYDGNPKRCTAKPSAELLLTSFDNLTLFTQFQQGHLIQRSLTPLNQVQTQVLQLLGLSPNLYHDLSAVPLVLPLSPPQLGREEVPVS